MTADIKTRMWLSKIMKPMQMLIASAVVITVATASTERLLTTGSQSEENAQEAAPPQKVDTQSEEKAGEHEAYNNGLQWYLGKLSKANKPRGRLNLVREVKKFLSANRGGIAYTSSLPDDHDNKENLVNLVRGIFKINILEEGCDKYEDYENIAGLFTLIGMGDLPECIKRDQKFWFMDGKPCIQFWTGFLEGNIEHFHDKSLVKEDEIFCAAIAVGSNIKMMYDWSMPDTEQSQARRYISQLYFEKLRKESEELDKQLQGTVMQEYLFQELHSFIKVNDIGGKYAEAVSVAKELKKALWKRVPAQNLFQSIFKVHLTLELQKEPQWCITQIVQNCWIGGGDYIAGRTQREKEARKLTITNAFAQWVTASEEFMSRQDVVNHISDPNFSWKPELNKVLTALEADDRLNDIERNETFQTYLNGLRQRPLLRRLAEAELTMCNK